MGLEGVTHHDESLSQPLEVCHAMEELSRVSSYGSHAHGPRGSTGVKVWGGDGGGEPNEAHAGVGGSSPGGIVVLKLGKGRMAVNICRWILGWWVLLLEKLRDGKQGN